MFFLNTKNTFKYIFMLELWERAEHISKKVVSLNKIIKNNII